MLPPVAFSSTVPASTFSAKGWKPLLMAPWVVASFTSWVENTVLTFRSPEVSTRSMASSARAVRVAPGSRSRRTGSAPALTMAP